MTVIVQVDEVKGTSKLHKSGKAHCLLIPSKAMRVLGWTMQDRMAIRVIGKVLRVERIPFEELANIEPKI